MTIAQLFNKSSKRYHAISGYQCFVVSDVDLNLTCCIFWVGLFDGYTDCGQVTANRS